ncbi:MAG: DMT family transporter [Pseudomonadota bacterium]
MTLSPPLIGHLAMLTFSALVAFSFTFGSMVANDVEPSVITALRFIIALAAMAVVARLWGMSLRFLKGRVWAWIVIGGLMAAYFITMFEALARTTALSTSAIFTLAPLMAAGFGWILLRLRTPPSTLAALVLGAIGALWVIFDGSLERLLRFDIGFGEALFFFGTLAHAAVPGMTRRLVPGVPSFEAATGTIFGALLVTVVYAIPDALTTQFTALPLRVWLVALYLGLVTTALSAFLIQVAIPRLPPGKVMAYTYLVPSWVALHALARGQFEQGPLYIGVGLTLVALALLLGQDMRGGKGVGAAPRDRNIRNGEPQ